MKGYVARKGIPVVRGHLRSVDPATGRERSWHAAGTERADAERLAATLAGECNGRDAAVRSLSFWCLPHHPMAAQRKAFARHLDLRRLQAQRRASRYAGRWARRPSAAAPAPPGSVLRRSAASGRETWSRAQDRLFTSPSAAHSATPCAGAWCPAMSPFSRTHHAWAAIPKVEQRSWTTEELQAFLRAAAGHRLFPAQWVSAFTGMRRNELLGLRWDDYALPGRRCRSTGDLLPSATSSTRREARRATRDGASTSTPRPSAS